MAVITHTRPLSPPTSVHPLLGRLLVWMVYSVEGIRERLLRASGR